MEKIGPDLCSSKVRMWRSDASILMETNSPITGELVPNPVQNLLIHILQAQGICI